MERTPLYERYRPKTWNEVIGQDAAVRDIQRLIALGEIGGNAYWISGGSGTGKTTIAKLLATELADSEFVQEIDATDLTPAGLNQIEGDFSLSAWGKGGRVIIVNEAHGLRSDTIKKLLVVLERIPSHCVWIFTTTKEGEKDLFGDSIDTMPLISRCIRLSLTSRNLCQAFAVRAHGIATIEGRNGSDVKKYERFLKDNGNNMRALLQAVQRGAFLGEENGVSATSNQEHPTTTE